MIKFGYLCLCSIFLVGCSSNETDRAAIVATYADIVFASYEDSFNAASAMDETIDEFISNPTEANLDAARQAWLDAREPYGQTEAYRFAGGPIDDADGPEGLLNAWPLDEAYVDYVSGDLTAGIINNPDLYPAIDAALIETLNEQGAEENVSTGYHAIEFLLWGQDLSVNGPGARSFTDYTTADNADRRKQYLAVASDLLLVHLSDMVAAWAPEVPDNYRASFVALENDQAIRNMLTGIGTLAKSELAVERIFVAVNNKDQEDEHSCFSDNSHRDIITNAKGIANVYTGSYQRVNGTTISGPSIADLVDELDAVLSADLKGLLAASMASVEAIPVPFDQAIINQEEIVLAAVDALQNLGDGFVAAAAAMNISINTDLPE